MTISDLVELAAGGTGDESVAAAERLTEIGEPALPAIIETVSNPFLAHGQLPIALKSIYLRSPVHVPIEALRAEEFDVFVAAVEALTEREDEQGRHALLERLEDSTENSISRARLARACGDIGDTAAVPTLRAALADSLTVRRAPDDVPRLTLDVVVALAKLGDFTEGHHAVALLADRYPPTCGYAAQALRVAVGPGMVDGLAGLVQSERLEGSQDAVDPLFLVGTPAAVQALIDAASSTDDPTVRNNALVRSNDILGTAFSSTPEDLGRLQGHWSQVSNSYDENTRYRSGEPFSVPGLLSLVTTNSRRNNEYLEELALAVGRRFTRHDELGATMRAQLSEEFAETGAYYRWGHLVPARLVLAPAGPGG